jgi:hypothetical protein
VQGCGIKIIGGDGGDSFCHAFGMTCGWIRVSNLQGGGHEGEIYSTLSH